MSKDPAFLFYYQDFLVGTNFMSKSAIGAYIRILCHLADKSQLSEDHVKRVCGTDAVFSQVMEKLQKNKEGFLFNKRLRDEVERRQKFTQSRRKNRNKANNDHLHLYLIRNPQNNLIKIGSSVNPERRLQELKNQENKDLELICYTEKTKQSLEATLHKKYKELRMKGEWFDIDPNHVINHMTNHMSLPMAYTYDQSYGN